MNIKEAIENVKKEIRELTSLDVSTVVGVFKDDEDWGWKVKMELVEKKSIPDSMDLLGLYEVSLNDGGEIMSFERRGLRKRGDLEKDEEYEGY